MIRCYLGLGSNQKYPERQIRQAIKRLGLLPSTAVTQVSSLYWNKAWGRVNQQDFCNAVVEIITHLPPLLLLHHCLLIEKKQGRVRKYKNGPRTLDVDIILYGQRKIQSKRLVVPHPGMTTRDSVLIPLHELYNRKTLSELNTGL